MSLATPLDSSFWSTGHEETAGEKAAKSNKTLWGSETVSLQNDPNNNYQLFFHSSLTNNDYKSSEEAVAAENDYRNKTGEYDPNRTSPLAPATGAQTPIENPNPPSSALVNQTLDQVTPPAAAPADTRTAQQKLGALGAAPAQPGFTNLVGSSAFTSNIAPRRPTMPSTPFTTFDVPSAPGAGGGTGPSIDTSNPGSPAPTVNRDQIDKILDPLSGYQNDIAALAGDNTGLSLAEAQLNKADALAKIRARDQLATNQAGALGAARSARNRGDRALLERQAIGEQSYLGSQAQRQDVLQQAELEGNLAGLRATEEDADRRFKLDALTKAADLGLNRGALEVDISKADLGSATNWINQEFQQLGLDKQLGQTADQFAASLDEKKMESILGFTQAMAAIQYQYDQLSVTDQNAADALLMQKYGVDQQTMVALKQIKQQGKFKWDNVLTALAGGAATGGTDAIAHDLLGGGGNQSTP